MLQVSEVAGDFETAAPLTFNRYSAYLQQLYPCLLIMEMMRDEWITCDFTSFSIVFQSYQDDERLMKHSVQWNPI